MFDLPQNTEIHRSLPKKAVFEKFELKPSQQKAFDADVSRMVITNMLSPHTLPSVAEGQSIKTIYVVSVQLKRKQYAQKSIELLSRLIPQKLLFTLQIGDEVQLAIHHTKLLTSGWTKSEETHIPLSGFDFDMVWENLVVAVSGIAFDRTLNLDEQIESEIKRQQTELRIAQLEKKTRAEKQPRRKWELVEEIRKLKMDL